MTDVYSYFYTINTNAKNETEEYLLDFNEITELDRSLKILPDISPSDKLVKKILELA